MIGDAAGTIKFDDDAAHHRGPRQLDAYLMTYIANVYLHTIRSHDATASLANRHVYRH